MLCLSANRVEQVFRVEDSINTQARWRDTSSSSHHQQNIRAMIALVTLLLLGVAAAIDVNTVRKDALARHNELRQKHHAPAMKLDAALNKKAQAWAEKLASMNKMQHSGPGENLYAGSGSVSGKGATDAWYSEVKDYDFGSPGFGMNTGHFTQVVWKGSTKLGVGIAKGSSMTFVVANYDPPGNMQGDFPKNVLKA